MQQTQDHIFLQRVMLVCGIGGVALMLIHALGLLTAWQICSLFSLPMWGNMQYAEIALPNLNIGLLGIGIALGISMRNRLGWWITNMMTTILFSLSFAFGTTWMAYLYQLSQNAENHAPLLPFIQSIIFSFCVVILSVGFLLYLFTKEVKILFQMETAEVSEKISDL